MGKFNVRVIVVVSGVSRGLGAAKAICFADADAGITELS